jgi:hypothetical protein
LACLVIAISIYITCHITPNSKMITIALYHLVYGYFCGILCIIEYHFLD